MPLTSLAVMPQYLEQVRQGVTGPTPLDAIEQRRAQRSMESNKWYDSQTERLKAMATKSSNTAASDKEARLAAEEEEAKRIVAEAFAPLMAMDPSDPNYTQQLQASSGKVLASGNLKAADLVMKIPSLITKSQENAGINQGSAYGANLSAGIRYKDAMAKMQGIYSEYYSNIPKTEARPVTKDELKEAKAAYQATAPEANDWIPFNEMSDSQQKIITGAAKALQSAYRARGQAISIGQATQKLLKGEEQVPQFTGVPPESPPMGGGMPSDNAPADDPLGLF